jgi:hypothetical protein
MPAQKQEKPSHFHLIACAVLALGSTFGAARGMAAENHFRVQPFASPAPVIGGETRIPAARPVASSPSRPDDGAASDAPVPEGRLRVRPMRLGGI